MNESPTAFRNKVGRTVCILIGIHLSLAFVTLLLPADYTPVKLVALYRRFILVGPFFQDQRIRSTTHLYVSYHLFGKWSTPRDYAHENFLYYTSHPWRYDKLHLGDFERYGSRALSEVEQTDSQTSRAFRELNDYVISELIRRPVDSVSLVYIRKHYQPVSDTFRTDTVFVHTYNPREVHAGKKMD